MKKILAIAVIGVCAAASAGTKVEFYAPDVVRVVKTAGETPAEATHPFETIVARPQAVEVAVSEKDGVRTYASERLVVREDIAAGTLTFATKGGETLLAEKSPARFHERDYNGVKNTGSEQTWRLGADEPLYGLGDRQPLHLDMRGWNGTLMPGNVGDGIAAFASIRGYGVLWDNTSVVHVKGNSPRSQGGEAAFTFESEIGDAVDYYFVYGPALDDVVAGFRFLTGDVPMFPRWTYGFWQSKERYKTQEETIEVVKKYRELGIPLDGIVQDWQYWGDNYLWNAMEFLSEGFREPKKFVDEVHAKNAKMLITIWQSFGPATKPYRELKEKNLLFPFETWPSSGLGHIWPPRRDYPSGVRLYDNYSDVARDIYWKHLHRLYDLGIDAWWMDSTDPDHMYKEGDFEHMTSLGCTWRAVRSAYPVSAVQAVYERQRKETDKRVFLLTRGAGLGSQRYGASVWSGDTGSSWDVLRRQIPGGLNYSLTGNPNFNCDLGGFFAGRYNRGGGVKNENWRELYVRWMQLGSFMPMMRSHGTDIPREIYRYGEKGEAVYDALVNSVRLRYTLMPYIYTVAANASQKRGGFMRPLAADFPEDRETWDAAGEFLVGSAILAAPVLNALYTNEDNKSVGEMEGWNAEAKDGATGASSAKVDYTAGRTHKAYLPKGADWWSFKSGKKFAGGQTIEFPVTLASQPFFVKAGSVIPLGPDVQFNGEKAWDELEIRVYPGADGTGELYEDDFETYACEKGEWSRIRFTWDDGARTLTIAEREGSYPGMLSKRVFRIILPDGTSKSVEYSGSELIVKL